MTLINRVVYIIGYKYLDRRMHTSVWGTLISSNCDTPHLCDGLLLFMAIRFSNIFFLFVVSVSVHHIYVRLTVCVVAVILVVLLRFNMKHLKSSLLKCGSKLLLKAITHSYLTHHTTTLRSMTIVLIVVMSMLIVARNKILT
uniref:Protein Daple n=1 Tax=Lygus hesperus TaxID=30085 RepID=A0A0A9X1P3_LYGHE